MNDPILRKYRERALISELQAFCIGAGLPQMSADEILFDDRLGLTTRQRKWLEVFMERWEHLFCNE